MNDRPIQLATVTASVRAGRFGPVVAAWFDTQLAERDDIVVDGIDLAELSLPVDLSGGGDSGVFAKRVARADAFIIVTPEYNHGYPGGLKTAIDTARDEWRAKAVGFVSYGGMAGGLRSVEQLRPVFAELQALTVRETVSFHWADQQFDAQGRLREPDKANAAAQSLLDQLMWWARTLRAARDQTTGR